MTFLGLRLDTSGPFGIDYVVLAKRNGGRAARRRVTLGQRPRDKTARAPTRATLAPRARDMPRATPLLLLLVTVARAADVFVIADTADQTSAIVRVANETIVEASDALAGNDTLGDPVVRKKRTFGDIVFRGLADVLGYNVARKAPQVVFPPPLAPVPGIDAPLPQGSDAPLQIPLALAADPAPCGRAVAPQPCAPPPPPPPPKPKPAPPPCPKPRANSKPKPKPKPRPKPKPQPPPCGSGRANPTTAAPCGAAAPKADSNLETISSDFRLDFNFNRKPATAAAAAPPEQPAEQMLELQQQDAPADPVVAIRPQAARLPPEPPRKPRVYLDAFVVQNGVTQKIQTIDARNAVQHQADNDYLSYDEPAEPPPPQQPQQTQPALDADYDYMLDSSERSKQVREFGTAVDKFWDQKKKKMKKTPAFDYRSVHFGDRNLANQARDQSDQSDERYQSMIQASSDAQAQPQPALHDDEEEFTTTTLSPRRRLKPRVLPPTEKNPNQIDTVTVQVPPIYKEKRPRKLHRERPESAERPEREEDSPYKPYEYNYQGSDGNGFYGYSPYRRGSDAESENSEAIYQTEQPKRKRRRKLKRKTRSVYRHYTAGDFDYYGKKLPISQEEQYFRGLTIPPPTRDPDVVRLERAPDGDGHFLDDHERLRDDPERIKTKKKGGKKQADDKDGADEAERSEEAERSGEAERLEESEASADAEISSEKERSGEKERADELSPNARVRETGYKNNYVHAHNVQVDDNQPLVRTVKRKKPKKA
ncbi:histone-lysine N-methyltransferase SETD1B-like [Maniola hyperantus]|uniref:histone-lysine N-methyltransferase SETD1B-like n=1 Tax=Aphantopus hyperantus TaxID=2795564 RepID=UPI001567D6EA|nr:proline-rich protein 12-like [Maniola hyperantus]